MPRGTASVRLCPCAAARRIPSLSLPRTHAQVQPALELHLPFPQGGARARFHGRARHVRPQPAGALFFFFFLHGVMLTH